MPSPSSPYKNLRVVQQTATQLTLQRGEPVQRKRIYGLNAKVLGSIVIAIVSGMIAIQRHTQANPFNVASLQLQWLFLGFALVVAVFELVARLGAPKYEVYTFDRAIGMFTEEADSQLGKRVVKRFPLEKITDVELIEEDDEGVVAYGIRLRLGSRKRYFLGWSQAYAQGKTAAINLNYCRNLTLQLRDFLLPECLGQTLSDQTTGLSLDEPLSAIETYQTQAKVELMDAFKGLGTVIFGSTNAKQDHMEKLHLHLQENPDDADANYNLALALSMNRKTQFDAIPYLIRARDTYRKRGDSGKQLELIERSLKTFEKQQRKQRK
jgi:hypothetical protein